MASTKFSQHRTKKASMSVLTILIIALVTFLVISSITVKFLKAADPKTAQNICKWNILSAHKELNNKESNFATEALKDNAAKTSLQSPLCLTLNENIDLAKLKNQKEYKSFKAEEEIDILAIQLGELSTNCWKTFANGQIKNTFAQDKAPAITGFESAFKFTFGEEDGYNYFFTCYRFKVHTENDIYSQGFDTSKLSQLFWKYDLNGNKINDAPKTGDLSNFITSQINKFYQGDEMTHSYASYILLESGGYYEFMDKVSTEISFDFNKIVSAVGEANLLSVASIPIAVIKGSTSISNSVSSKNYPGSGIYMEKLIPETYYEVRYYSPYFGSYDDDNLYNNIKIVPVFSGDDDPFLNKVESK